MARCFLVFFFIYFFFEYKFFSSSKQNIEKVEEGFFGLPETCPVAPVYSLPPSTCTSGYRIIEALFFSSTLLLQSIINMQNVMCVRPAEGERGRRRNRSISIRNECAPPLMALIRTSCENEQRADPERFSFFFLDFFFLHTGTHV